MYCTPVLFIVQLSAYLDNPDQKKKKKKKIESILKENWDTNGSALLHI